MALNTRLPGISIGPVLPPARGGLPPMDVALFAGFAARGPCNRAVAVDSVAAFETCFGGDVPLARDSTSGQMLFANLPASVRAFFANGGQRCWVVRLARTAEHAARWALYTGSEADDDHIAASNRFAVGGMLCRLPGADGGDSKVRPAFMQASSVGSWSDDLQLSARINQYPFVADDLRSVEFGLRFTDPGGLNPGDLIEFFIDGDMVRRYAKVMRFEGGNVLAIWCASLARAVYKPRSSANVSSPVVVESNLLFDYRQSAGKPVELTLDAPIADLKVGQWLTYPRDNDIIWFRVGKIVGANIEGSSWRVQGGHAQTVGHRKHHDATLVEGVGTQIVLDGESHDLQEGKWLHFWSQGESVWMLVERIDGNKAFGAAWQQVASRLPRGRFSARRVTVDFEVELNGSRHVLTELNPGLTGARSIHSLVTDDEDYSADDARRARGRFETCVSVDERDKVTEAATRAEADFDALAAKFGTTAFTASHREALRHAWLPIGLTTGFDLVASAVPQARDALARDGLSGFDDTLFLDPALAETRVSQIMPVIERIRDIDQAKLTGIHAGLDAPDHVFGIASILAVPDAAQPGWEEVRAAGLPSAAPDAPDRADWYDHLGGCAARLPENVADYRTAPDRSRFLDCATRLIAAPNLSGPRLAVRDGSFTLNWSGSEVGANFVLEEAASADFTGAVEIYRGADQTIDLTRLREGAYYYRLYCEMGSNVSAYSAVSVLVRQSSFQTVEPDIALLKKLHLATIRLAAGTSDMFALLSMPQHFRSTETLGYNKMLRSISDGYGGVDELGRDEERALSYAALYHPWLYYRNSRDGQTNLTQLSTCVPDGCVAGQMAASAMQRGAWIAPANDLFADIVGLSPNLPDAEQLPLYNAAINMVRRAPDGFLLLDADTLAHESEWTQINVRRLMILLRRLAIVRGQTYVFEPNDNIMRRAVERDLTMTLDDMQRRGAFAGKTAAQSYRVAADRRVADIENGRMTFEIGVAPSQPMRFLNVRLVQQGGRLTVAEEAA